MRWEVQFGTQGMIAMEQQSTCSNVFRLCCGRESLPREQTRYTLVRGGSFYPESENADVYLLMQRFPIAEGRDKFERATITFLMETCTVIVAVARQRVRIYARLLGIYVSTEPQLACKLIREIKYCSIYYIYAETCMYQIVKLRL